MRDHRSPSGRAPVSSAPSRGAVQWYNRATTRLIAPKRGPAPLRGTRPSCHSRTNGAAPAHPLPYRHGDRLAPDRHAPAHRPQDRPTHLRYFGPQILPAERPAHPPERSA